MYHLFFFSIFFLFFVFKVPPSESSPKPLHSSFKIQKIVIQGHDKIEETAIRNKLLSKEGDYYSKKKVKQDVKSLFDMGFFYDIVVERKKSKTGFMLVYILTEKPVISSIKYEGNFKIQEEDLKKASQVKAYQILNRAQLNEDLKKIEKLYEEKGFLLAQVEYEVKKEKSKKDPERGEKFVQVIFKIKENKQVKIKKVRLLGNKFFSSEKLKSVLFTKENGFFSFMQKEKSYKKETFERDIQILNYFYYNEGFIQVFIDQPEVFISPDKRFIYITIHITEGNRFKVGDIKFTGNLLFSQKHFQDITQTKSGEFFSYHKLQEDLKTLQREYGDLGYAFVNPIPYTSVREKEKLVNINFKIEKGQKAYINEIHILGNSKTRDKVIRRELRIQEGELYHETRKQRSLANIKRLGFFEEVDFLNKISLVSDDSLDIHIRVKERNTGAIQAGLGYSSHTGMQLQGELSLSNFLGYGQRVQFSAEYIKDYSMIFQLGFLDLYFLDSDWEFGADVYVKQFKSLSNQFGDNVNIGRTRHPSYGSILDYSMKEYGGKLQIGYPFSDYWRGALSYKFEKFDLTWNPVWANNGIFLLNEGILSSLTTILSFDKRNDRFITTRGAYLRNSLELAGFGGNLKFVKGLASFRYFKNLFWKLIWRNNFNYGFLFTGNRNKLNYITEMFRLGGPDTLRGYSFDSIGKIQFSARDEKREYSILGGLQQIYYQSELQFPLVEETKIYGAFFYDMGMARDKINLNSFHHNIGFGLRLFTPMAPFRIEWAFPLNTTPFSPTRRAVFVLSMGPPF